MPRHRELTDEQRKENRKKVEKAYRNENIKRIPLDVQQEEYKQIKSAAEAEGMPVNGWIKTAIREKLDGGNQDD